MANVLAPGTQRLGALYDGYEETPEVAVTLEYTDQGIGVVIPWNDPDSPYARWFFEAPFTVPPCSEPEGPPAPKRVLFHDSHGQVLLLRCRPRGIHSNLFGPGTGRLIARAAVIGGIRECEYEKPHALKTEISGLRQWLRADSWHEEVTFDDDRQMSITSAKVPAVILGGHHGAELSLETTWHYVPMNYEDQATLRTITACVTRSEAQLEWDEHLHGHRAIRDLLVISTWRPETCRETTVVRNDDTMTRRDGISSKPLAREVVVYQDESEPPPAGRRDYLIEYTDLGEDGLKRWLRLRDEFSRALDPVITAVALQGATANTLLAHTGPGLEALGYLLLRRDGMKRDEASNAHLKGRLERILLDVREALPFDGDAWIERTVKAYNGLKHANRKELPPIDVINAWAECITATRVWVALELGVPSAEVKKRISLGSQHLQFEPAW